ncbi:MAG: zf-HC2 domain-containing protein [bacterium]|nr:zf-HC2 domain-containing protein [bacterium]
MTHAEAKHLLNDFSDGLLPEGQHREMSQHLKECAVCREEWRGLQNMLDGLAALPAKVAPEWDLWPGIVEEIGGLQEGSVPVERAGQNRVWLRRVGLAAAAVVLMAFSSALTALWLLERPQPVALGGELQKFEAIYALSIHELSGVLHERQDALLPETVQTIQENLDIIDTAIRASREALIADPGNRELIQTVATLYEEKVSLLQHVTDLPNGS